MARSRRESLLSDGITDQKCPQGLLQQNLPQADIPKHLWTAGLVDGAGRETYCCA
jgi:hypothetical protein